MRGRSRWFAAAAVAGLAAGGCTSDTVTPVEVTAVAVHAPVDTLEIGETARFTVDIRDQGGNIVPTGIGVEWTAAPASVVTVDATGLVTAVGPGEGTVRATAGGKTGTATVQVAPPPTIAVDPAAVEVVGMWGGDPPPDPVVVEIVNAGAGALSGLEATVTYTPGGPTGWLTPALESTAAPTTLRVTVSTTGLEIGSYEAAVALASPAAPGGPVELPVRLRVVADEPVLQVTPALAGFSGVSGGDLTPQQTVAVTNAGGGSLDDLSVEVVHEGPEGWLDATLTSATLPSTLVLRADPGPLPPGSYQARARLHSATALNAPADVLVSFNVEARTGLKVTALGPDSAAAGARIDYAIELGNEGPSVAEQVVLVDSLPGGVTVVDPPPGATVGEREIRWELGDVAPGSRHTFDVSVVVSPALTGAVENRIVAASPSVDLTPGAREAVVVTRLVRVADLAVATIGPDSAQAGREASWRTVVRNLGPSDAAGVVVTGVLPDSVDFASASDGGSAQGRAVAWPVVSTLAVGDSLVRTATVHLPSRRTGILVNSAAVESSGRDPTSANDSSVALTPVLVRADLEAIAEAPDTMTAGTPHLLVAGVRNRGPGDAVGVVLRDTLPAGAVFISATGGGAESGGVVSWPSIARLPSGDSVRQEVVVEIPASGAGVARNAVVARSPTVDPDPASSSAATSSAVVALAELRVAISGPATDTAGTTASYAITVHNSGPSDARDVVVTDTLPGGATLVAAGEGGVGNGGVAVWPAVPVLAAGDSAVRTLEVRWDPDATGSATQVATVAAGTANPTPGDQRAELSTTLVAVADVSVVTTGPAVDTAGTAVSWTVTAANAGPSAAAGVEVVDSLPAGLTGVSASGGGVVSGREVRWAVGALAPGASTAAFTVTGTVAADATGDLVNRAVVTTTSADPAAGNDRAEAVTELVAVADLSVVTTGPASAAAGEQVTFTLTVTTAGPSAATELVVSDTLPAGLTFVSATGAATHADGVVTWPAATLAPGGSPLSHDVVVEIDGGVVGPLTHTAAVTSATPDPDLGGNVAAGTITVTGPEPEPVAPGGNRLPGG